MERSRKKQVEFHIQSDDYFVGLATLLDLMEQDMQAFTEQLESLKKDLLFLQENYCIKKREE